MMKTSRLALFLSAGLTLLVSALGVPCIAANTGSPSQFINNSYKASSTAQAGLLQGSRTYYEGLSGSDIQFAAPVKTSPAIQNTQSPITADNKCAFVKCIDSKETADK